MKAKRNAETNSMHKTITKPCAVGSEQLTSFLPKLNDREAAQFCGVSVATLRRHRWLKTGPSYFKLNSRVIYDQADLLSWLNKHRVQASVEAA